MHVLHRMPVEDDPHQLLGNEYLKGRLVTIGANSKKSALSGTNYPKLNFAYLEGLTKTNSPY
ncbi:hypothetical protein DQW77_13775 [Roseovarius sp. TE539]|nr:hypothetical protein DQW77_13775 [Roseovarius sp. TE539]